MYRLALLALLLVLSAPIAAGVDPPTPERGAVADDSTAGRLVTTELGILVLEGDRRSDFSTAALDIGTAVAIQYDAAALRLDEYTLDDRLSQGASDSERRDAYVAALEDARLRSDALRERDRTLRGAYRNGTIDAPAYVRGLADVNARAGALQRQLAVIDARADGTADLSLETRMQTIESRLVELQGPVRDRARGAVYGEREPTRLYVSASDAGVALAMISEERYVREVYRADKRSEAIVEIPFETVVDRMRALYPTAFNQSEGWGIQYASGGGVYQLTFDPTAVTLLGYLHGGTQEVYYEVRERDLSGPMQAESAVTTANGTRLVVNRSIRGGPLRVAAYDNSTGSAVDTTVIVGGDRFETGPDGVFWALTPDRGRFTVTVVRPSGNVTTVVRPLQPTPIDGSG